MGRGGGGGGGLKREPDFFWWGGGGGDGAEACYRGKIRVLVTLRYRKVDLKLNKQCVKAQCFYNL